MLQPQSLAASHVTKYTFCLRAALQLFYLLRITLLIFLEGMIVYRQTLHWLEVKLPLVSFRTQGLFDTLGKEVSSNIRSYVRLLLFVQVLIGY
jgi:hypothetical protein